MQVKAKTKLKDWSKGSGPIAQQQNASLCVFLYCGGGTLSIIKTVKFRISLTLTRIRRCCQNRPEGASD